MLEESKKTILSNEDFQLLSDMGMLSLYFNKKVTELLSDGEIEKSFFWEDKGSQLIVKARPDILHENMIIDLKTISDASFNSFQRAMVEGWVSRTRCDD